MWQHYTGQVSHALHAKLGDRPSWHSGAWYALQDNRVMVHAPLRRVGVGATSGVNSIVADPSGVANDTLAAASALLTSFTSNASGTTSDCSNPAISGSVSAFQAAANASGISAASSAGGNIAVDGEYGPQTASVLQDVIDGAQAAGIPITTSPAPSPLFGAGNLCASAPVPVPVPVPVPTPVTPPSTPTVVNNTTTTTTGTSSSVIPILLGTAVVLGLGAGAYYMMKKHPRHAHA